MLGVKLGTQTWSSAPQKADYKSDGTQNLSANARAQVMGQDESIGDVLNRVSDPNYVDQSKKMRTVGANELGKDAFMTLLLTQMKNQDPTNPLKSHEMAAQLAQFTSLEKLNNINEGIDGLRKDQQPSHNFEALSFIGKMISTDNGKITRLSGDTNHEIHFQIPSDAQKLTLTVKDGDGKTIRTLEHKNLKTGENTLTWNGQTEEGATAPAGDYTATFEAIGSNGRKIFVETRTEGLISGVNFTARGPQLLVGKQTVNLSDVKSISDPNVKTLEPGPRPIGEPPPDAHSTSKPVRAASPPGPKGRGNLDQAAMASGLINKLTQEGAKAGMQEKSKGEG